MATVYDRARDLVKAVLESDEARQMRRHGAKVKGDPRLNSLLSDFRKSQLQVQTAQAGGEEPAEEQVEEWQQLSRAVESEPQLREYISAEAAYGNLLIEVQRVLAEVLQPEVAGPVRQRALR